MRVTVDLQDNFALHQPLSLFAMEALGVLEPDEEDYHLNVLSVMESVMENPSVILEAQTELLRKELLAELKAERVPYEDRKERLEEVEHPKPLREFLYGAFNVFRAHHPWVEGENVRPKSIARDLRERAMTFGEYVNHYGISRSEGLLLRYLTEVYRGLRQNVPDERKTEAVEELADWLRTLIGEVDSSLLDEWEILANKASEGASEGR